MPYNIQNVTQAFLDTIKLPSPNGKKLNYLIVLPCYRQDDYAYFFPMGLAMVSSALKASGRNVRTLNLNYKDNHLNLLSDTIIKYNIDVILCGCLSFQYTLLKEIFDTAKNTKPEIITVAGGGIITADPVVAMQALETADYGVVGEGEITVNELAYTLENDNDISKLRGVAVNRGSVITLLPAADEISNLDLLPFPDYEGLEYDVLLSKEAFSVDYSSEQNEDMRKKNVLPTYARTSLIMSRSCPYKCTFCFHPSGTKYRRRSIENVFKELDYLIDKYKISYFRFNDEMFVSNDEFIKEFCEKITPYKINFWIQTRVDSVNKESMQLLKYAGCTMLSLGVESADNTILKSMKKHITVEQIENAFEMAKEVGINTIGSLIFGDPAENEQTIRNTLNWRVKHFDYYLEVNWILSFPGSENYEVACKRGVIKDRVAFLKSGCPQVNISQLSDAKYWEMVDRVRIFNALFNAGIYLDIDDIQLDNIKDKLNGLVNDSGKVAVWPATVGTINLLNSISPEFINNDNVYYVNLNPSNVFEPKAKDKWHINALNDYGRIYTPKVIEDENIQTVICPSCNPLMPEIPNEIEDMCKREYPNVKHFIKLADLFSVKHKR